MVVALIQSSDRGEDPTSVALVILGVLGTIVAWVLVNTVYVLKYARMYFLDHPDDGFDVKQEAQPAYSDFAYFAFTVLLARARNRPSSLVAERRLGQPDHDVPLLLTQA